MKSLDEPPYLSVGTDVSAKYRGAFCEAKIKSTKRLVKVKATYRQDSATVEVQDDHVKGSLKVGAVVEIKSPDGTYQAAIINKLTDASWYTVVFDDGDEKTLRRSSLCLKGERHFAASETLDQLPLTNPEHFGTPVIGKKTNRGRRSNNPVHEEESTSSSSDEEENESNDADELVGTVVCIDVNGGDKKKATLVPALVVSSDCSDDITVKKDFILVRSFKDGKFTSVAKKDVRDIDIGEISAKNDHQLKEVLEQALEFRKNQTIPPTWKTELKHESSSSETEEEDEESKEDQEDSSSEEEEIEPFPGENEHFLQQLYKFMEDRGTPINKRPVLGYRNLNLFKLFRLVHKLGGFNNIDSGAVWKQVYQDLGIPILNSAAGYNVKCAYKKYLYGFEEYCSSASISFHMELPIKISQKVCKDCVHENKVPVNQEPESLGEIVKEEFDTKHEIFNNEVSVNEIKHPTVEEMIETQFCKDNKVKEEEEDSVDKQQTLLEEASQKTEDPIVADENKKEDEMKQDEEPDEDEDGESENEDSEEGEEFESYPSGVNVQVRYGRGKNQKLYEASVKDSDVEGGEVHYMVHYCGWNVRYDEWIKADRIVRPVDKSVPKIKHRKKIKNKMEQNSDKCEKDESSPKKCRLFSRPLFQPCDLESKSTIATPEKPSLQGPHTTVEITSILNGLQAAENFADDREMHQHSLVISKEEKEMKINHINYNLNQSVKENNNLTRTENGITPDVSKSGMPRSPDLMKKKKGKSSDDSDFEVEATRQKKYFKTDIVDKVAKSQIKRGKRKYSESGNGRSPSRKDEYTKCKRQTEKLDVGIISSSDDEEKSKSKNLSPSKYNGLEDKRKSLRTGFYAGFGDIPEKRTKLLNHSEERHRAKERKDVWSSIQGQWPKKTLKELFSDSDTECAVSPSTLNLDDSSCVQENHDDVRTPSPEVKDNGLEIVDEKTEAADKKIDFPSSGSNSVLNTPPTTPESPSSLNECRKKARGEILDVLEPNPEEVQSIKSETDSTIEVDSVSCELQDLQFEGNFSPVGFEACISSSSSNQQEPENKEKEQKTQEDQEVNVVNNTTKQLKRSHKSSIQKKRKTANTSDSEDLSGGESVAKMLSDKPVTSLKSQNTKVPPRMHSPGKYAKNREKDPFQKDDVDRIPKVYKWSFHMYHPAVILKCSSGSGKHLPSSPIYIVVIF
ncbi:hypothetical protein GDO86_009612 [Hymenochirus boettgeri]|uniref:ARID domain-containing protein n=1 Tax=Hymenochirus boettgeri TaxID=247094 RepID=A0A8T2JPK2_9PIPI|nr:hypothetical protein GDO86_009612 [Hymenochirus boettgeri]